MLWNFSVFKVLSIPVFLWLSLSGLSAGERLRIVAANLSSGKYQAYESPGIRLFQGLDPDIVLIQEFNYRSGSLDDLIAESLGREFDFYVEPGDEQIPNGIASRYPILAAGEWLDSEVSNRDFVWARIDIPGEIDLWAVSVHFLTRNASKRNAQARSLLQYIRAEVPKGAYLVVGGDLNTAHFKEPALKVLSAVVATEGHPSDQDGKTGTNASRSKPYDQVWPDPDLKPLEIPVRIDGHPHSYVEGLVFDSRVFTPLSAVRPIRFGDSAGRGMQHMAVVRDFSIPVSTD